MPAVFETGIQQVSASVGSVAAIIWQPSNTSTTTYGPLGSITAGAVLKDVQVINTGSNAAYVGMGSAAAGTTTGAQVQPGGAVTFTGYNVTAGTGTTGNIWANTGAVGATTSFLVGMVTVSGQV